MQVKPKMAAVFRTLNSFFFFFFRTLNSSDWLVYGLAFMFASTLPASRHFYPSRLFTLSELNLGRASIYALKKVNCICVLKLGLGFCNGRYAVSNSRLTGLSGHFCWNEVKIIVYCDERGGARVFKPSWMTGKNNPSRSPYAHTRSAARFLSCASIVALSLMLGFDISFLPTHCNFANFLIFIPH